MTHDPFFTLPNNSTWNACIGKQGDEVHYLDGYIEAAWELADAVIEKEMYGKRDTLVLPILYNARHAVELLLKFLTHQLLECGAIPHGHPANHDIQSHFDLLFGTKIGDEKFAIPHQPIWRGKSQGRVARQHRDHQGQPKRTFLNH